eukprot:scpid101655/ scgid14999/ 
MMTGSCVVSLEYDDGDLEQDELLFLVTGIHYAAARGMLISHRIVPMRLDIASPDDETCIRRFRFTGQQLKDLCFALQVPQNYRSPDCQTKWSGMEGLLILLRRLCYPSRLSDLCDEFGRSKPVLSLIFNTMLMWIWLEMGPPAQRSIHTRILQRRERERE